MKLTQQPQTNLYAVYGTLRKGFGNHKRLLDNEWCDFLGEVRMTAPFIMVSLGGFPGLIPSTDCQEITFEVFRVNQKGIEKALDMLEGYPDFYEKCVIKTPFGEANLYYLHSPRYKNYPILPSGDWKAFRESAVL